MKDFRSLKVWEKSHQLVLQIYSISYEFPKDELFGLTSQMRRSVASIPTNIAEGCGRDTAPDFMRFLQIAFGSANELEYQLLLAHDLNFIGTSRHSELEGALAEVKKMLWALIQKLKADR